MQADATPQAEVNRQIQRSLADESTTELRIVVHSLNPPLPLTVTDARCIIHCFRENRRFDTLYIFGYSLHDDAVLNVLRDGLPLCTSVSTVKLYYMQLGNEGLDRLRPAFYNTSITKLDLTGNMIQGQRGGEVLRDLLVGNDTLVELDLSCNCHFGPEAAMGFGQGLRDNHGLQKRILLGCNIGNQGLDNLVLSMGETNNNPLLLHLDLSRNNIQGSDGGSKVTLLLQRFPALKVLGLGLNNLGPLVARALAPALAVAAAASQLEELDLYSCGLGNDGMANLVPGGQVNRSLTHLSIGGNNIQGTMGGEIVLALAARCMNLDRLDTSGGVGYNMPFSPDQQRRLDLLLDRKRLVTAAQALAGSTFSVLFRFVEEAHCHEHGLGAIFVILQK